MVVNLLFGVAIFGYAAYTLIRFVNKSKQGKCATCAMKEGCQTACDSSKQ
ncbi:FeoB-associated Cys-rich membrane protein [Laceyella putida]|uniref:FeoB-associated Cys-rich membrane protein n=1 Tax=Laceyella putida TaxID=110101 RepID=A0ABW2RIN9_9BACL